MGKASRGKWERRKATGRRVEDTLKRVAAGEARGCLVCRGSDGGFATQEHVVPESLGNTELLLPSGVVCDRCNRGTLSQLDQKLCDFHPLKMIRTLYGIKSKAGKIPEVRLVNGGRISNAGGSHLVFEDDGVHSIVRETGHSEDRIELKMQAAGGAPTTPRNISYISRSLLKIALECIWLDHGEVALEPRFDHLRSAVLGEPFDGFLAAARLGVPSRQFSIQYDLLDIDDGCSVPVLADFYGMTLMTASPSAAPVSRINDEEVLLATFRSGDLRRSRS